MRLSRRAMLGGAVSALATGAAADGPLTSIRPIARNPLGPVAARMINQSGLSGKVGFSLVDVATGEVLEGVNADTPRPPASVSKVVTALYAIEALGPDHRFETRLLADGEIRDGVLNGNLILAGGGDPNLITDHLATLADTLRETGLKEVTGDFLVWDNALVNLDEIDSSQLDYLGYNPTITGLNLNFNRVHFEWKRAGDRYTTAMDARSADHRPAVTVARMQIIDRASPVFTYRDGDGVDEWTVARRALNNGGSRWLPVRYPALYAGEVFATFARTHGIVLKPAREVAILPDVRVVATFRSVPLIAMMRDMLRYSTNITAEAAGLSATLARTGQKRGLRTSALGMTRWAVEHSGMKAKFVDHSGLGDASRISAGDMVGMLTADGVMPILRPILKEIKLVDRNRKVIPSAQGQVLAKTGTLNFVSSLAGYVRTSGGRDLAFAFFAADLSAREQGKASGDEQPVGAVGWNTRARRLQQQILQHWALRQ